MKVYKCKRHGVVEPYVYFGPSGKRYRYCKECRATVPLEPKKPYMCKIHGLIEPYIHGRRRLRNCSICWAEREASPKYKAVQRAGHYRRWADIEWRAKHLAYSKEHNRQLKQETLDAYGGKCFCCGEATFEFLTVDHIGGGGREHRQKKKLLGTGAMYRWLKKQNFPQEGFRLLCINCNFSNGRYGYCPHEKTVRAMTG